jgi:hypothetical protein
MLFSVIVKLFSIIFFLKQFFKDQWKFYWYMINIFIGELQKVINCLDSIYSEGIINIIIHWCFVGETISHTKILPTTIST